jgi:hypothetical protein
MQVILKTHPEGNCNPASVKHSIHRQAGIHHTNWIITCSIIELRSWPYLDLLPFAREAAASRLPMGLLAHEASASARHLDWLGRILFCG